jgi:hypothetical protein
VRYCPSGAPLSLAGYIQKYIRIFSGFKLRPGSQNNGNQPMKITAVRTHILEAALSEPFAYSRAW